MADEMELAQLLDQFVDDLNNGRVPRIYELMVSDPETVAELIPLLDLAAWFKTSNVQAPATDAETIKNLSDQVNHARGNWSMQRLIAEGDPQVVAKSKAFGLGPTQLRAVSSDTTPFDLRDSDRVNEIVARLARKHQMRSQGLLGWVRQLISSALHVETNSSMSMVFARDAERRQADKSE